LFITITLIKLRNLWIYFNRMVELSKELTKTIRRRGNLVTSYKFDDKLKIRLVRGIEKGYSGYAEVRREKRNELRISGAYAWVKGNRIADQVANELLEIGMEISWEKAGYTWEYLSFTDTNEKYMMIIKNANIIKGKSKRPILDAQNPENYLVDLSKINSHVDFDEVKGSKQGVLELDFQTPLVPKGDENIEELRKEYKHFYILTYSIEKESKMLSSIDLWMPEFIKNNIVEMVQIDSLKEYLGQTGAEINLEAIHELTSVPEEEFSGTAAEFDYKTIEETETKEA
jgi:hypothetical protein